MAYSLDLRKRVLAFIAAGGSKTQASQRFSVARSTLFDVLSSLKAGDSYCLMSKCEYSQLS